MVLLVRVQFSLIACGKNLSYACSAYGNSVSSPWFGRLESSDGPLCFPHTPPGVNVPEGQNNSGCCKSINDT